MKIFSLIRTIGLLGWRNCFLVLFHRFYLRFGFYERRMLIRDCPVPDALASSFQSDPLVSAPFLSSYRDACLEQADSLLSGKATWFSNETYQISSPPDWFFDPSSGNYFQNGSHHWTRCKPFAASDIKRCWELSRWGWAPLLMRAWRFTHDKRYLDALNAWIQSWCDSNPVNGGSNWLCSQEASIRLLHALQVWQLSDFSDLIPSYTSQRAAFVATHLERISSTVLYAEAQDNNHWTSEAAALFIGGSWLASTKSSYALAGSQWAKTGRRALECSVNRLVLQDGSFAQHSLTYHRLLLDTLVQVELWRRLLALDPFTDQFSHRCSAATSWLLALVDPISGDGPNLGSNDGAFCYQLHSLPYRDFRPTLQLASSLFHDCPCWANGPWDEPLYWYGLVGDGILSDRDPHDLPSPFTLFENGGYAVIRPSTSSWALLRLPTYRFRPVHADPLHFDLWHRGVNLLRDGGSYAYNGSAADLAGFPGIACHNTVQFDHAEPMPRLGRFLWGDWLKLEGPPKLQSHSISAAYCSPHGRHHRQVEVDDSGLRWIVTDTCSGFDHEAVLRWRLCTGDWRQEGASLIGPMATLQVHSDQPLTRIELGSGWESQHYGEKSSLPVLEICVGQAPVTLTTSFHLIG